MRDRDAAPRFRRLAPRSWSLQVRLLVGVVVLAALALGVTGSVGTALLRSYLVQQVDQQLLGGEGALNGPLLGSGNRGGPPPSRPNLGDQLPNPLLFTILSTTGTTVQQFGGPSASSPHKPDLRTVTTAKVKAEAGRAFTVPALNGGADFRVRAVERQDGSGAGAVTISLQPVDSAVHRLRVITWSVAAGVLVLLLVLGSFAVRVALRPLEAVERTAEEIAGGDLSRRVPVARGTTEIGRLATTLNVMLGKVEAAFQAQHYSETTLRQFVADASHELRTPLTAIRGYAELDRKGALVDAAARDHAMRRIESEATRMGVLVDDLLLLAHLDQQRPLDVSTVDLAVLLTEGVADARAQDPDRPIEFHPPDEPVLVDVDSDRFRQVVANLLGNAIAHTPPGTSVTVTLALTPATADGRAVFTVADDGPGLTADQVSRLFERFYRADPSRTRRGRGGGSGLGLSIVRSVVAASHGAVEATSEPGRGTTFTVSLPVHAPAEV